MSVDYDEALRVLAEAGIVKKDASTSMTVLQNRLTPIFFLPRLRRMLEELQLDESSVEEVFVSFFGSDAGRAALVIAGHSDGS